MVHYSSKKNGVIFLNFDIALHGLSTWNVIFKKFSYDPVEIVDYEGMECLIIKIKEKNTTEVYNYERTFFFLFFCRAECFVF